MNKALENQLTELLGPDSVSTLDIERRQYAHDMAPVPKIFGLFFKTMPDAIVRPNSSQQVQQLVKFTAANGVPLIPRGRSTTMMGGSYPVWGGISVDMTARKGIISLDEANRTVKVSSGIIWDNVLRYLEKRGLTLYCYPTSAPSATVGGWLGNGGVGLGKGGLGIGSPAYGYAADTVVDLGVVLPSGEYIESVAASQYKVQDFIGSDGVLAIYDTVTLRVRPLPARQEPFSFNFNEVTKLCWAVKESAALKPFFLLIEDEGMLGFKKKAGLHVPPAKNLVTVVLEGEGASLDSDIQELRKIMITHGGQELSREIAEEEWAGRYYAMRHKSAGPNLLGGEFSAPIDQLTEVVRRVNELAENKNITIGIHGTLGVNEMLFMPQVLSDERKKFRYLTMMSLVKDLNDMSIDLGGVPYGAGLFNAFYAKEIHGERFDELVQLKKELDPRKVMNPGKAIHCMTRFKIALPKFAYGLGMFGLGLFVKYGK
ncbi:FAD/FMN-dependent dehydrogenase [Desulfitobacterium dehalogenans ATCC 51507]|uniref:D-lactate dehydrogenase (cytochrome) n=1 Tax=Desulfitobacterium dehalogenans (strain ATCC 51507 / DSM 9161 / JW/IU-DC1) TaxID=756499 RepID=I4A5J0_DESDJ|nr:FAD-binding oxidoreductase [Desulfitobacterium dehalogenans]AFL99224.1 FAD/FMN-dependent dehydrogenase [Desulfitobacterium dehalogenans ATCC 51507]